MRFAGFGSDVGRRTSGDRIAVPSPVDISRRPDVRFRRGRTRPRGLLGPCPCWYNPVPPARTRSENAVIPDLMRPRRRIQRRQTFEQLPPLHHDMRRPVSPGSLEPIGATVGHPPGPNPNVEASAHEAVALRDFRRFVYRPFTRTRELPGTAPSRSSPWPSPPRSLAESLSRREQGDKSRASGPPALRRGGPFTRVVSLGGQFPLERVPLR